MVANTVNIDFLKTLYSLKLVYYGVVGLSSAPTALLTFFAFYSFVEADAIGAYTLSSNVLYYSGVTLLPFFTLFFMTICMWDMRSYEVNGQDVEFDTDYHFGPHVHSASASAKKTSMLSKKAKADADLSRELTVKLLKSYLEEPRTLTVPEPDLEQTRASEL